MSWSRWRTIWMTHLAPKCTGIPVLHTDGLSAYRSTKWDFNNHYAHHWVNHNKKEYWVLNRATSVQSGTLAIDNAWLHLKRILNSLCNHSITHNGFHIDYVFTAAWLWRQRKSVDSQIQSVSNLLLKSRY